MMKKIERLLGIIVLLQSRRLIRAQDMAEHFEVSLRTIYRDLKILDSAGLPLIAEAGLGYALMDGYRLPPIMFTEQEMSALYLGGKFVEKLTDRSLEKSIESALAKILAVLPQQTRDYFSHLDDTIYLDIQSRKIPDEYCDDVLAAIQNAIIKRNVLEIEYHAIHKDQLTRRDIEPISLIYYGSAWHLFAFCRLRREYRDFRTDRIQSLHPKDELFVARGNFSAREYLHQSESFENALEVQIRADKQVANYLRQNHPYGLLDQTDDGDRIILSYLVPAFDSFIPWILAYGTTVEVLSPPQFRERMGKILQEITVMYA